jgi:hypothetical protein
LNGAVVAVQAAEDRGVQSAPAQEATVRQTSVLTDAGEHVRVCESLMHEQHLRQPNILPTAT